MATYFIADRQIDTDEAFKKLINPYNIDDCHESKWAVFHEGGQYEIEALEAYGGKYVGGSENSDKVLGGGKMVFGDPRLDDPTRETYKKARALIDAQEILADAEKVAEAKRVEAARIIAEAEGIESSAVEVSVNTEESASIEAKKSVAKVMSRKK